MSTILSKLSKKEQDALALCGILNDSQLARISPETILADLEKAREVFPDADLDIPAEKVRELCHRAATAPADETEAPAPQQTETPSPVEETPGTEDKDDEEEDGIQRALPELSLRRHQHHGSARRTPKELTEAPGVAHSVHCSRPISVYLAAVFMLLFYAGATLLILIPLLVFMGRLEGTMVYVYAGAGLAALSPYFLMGAWVHCSVCKMNMFTLMPYNINRHAHTIPFIGWTTLVTALHIIFLLWYRCPACGTSIRLFRSRHSNH